MSETKLAPSQRGDELCLNCKREWQRHHGRELNCKEYGSSDKFEPSGRIEPPDTPKEIHHHAAPHRTATVTCQRCGRPGHTSRECRIMMAQG